jgi:hypothetical protein
MNRRDFVALTPLLALGPPLLAQPAGRRNEQLPVDTVLEGILQDFRDLKDEWDTKPNQRQAVTRATESLSGVLGAHLGAHYDANVKRGLRRAIAKKGRQAFVQDQVSRLPNVRHEDYDKFLDRFEKTGFEGVFKDGQKALRKLREQNPNFQRVAYGGAATMQYDFCADLNWIINLCQWSLTLCTGIAILEPTVGGEIACGAIAMALAMYEAMRWWYGC